MAGRSRFSNWHVTISSNLPNNAANRASFTAALDEGLRYAQNNIWLWLRMSDGTQLDAAERREVIRTRARVGLEHGARNNPAPHAHILLEVTHRLQVRANYARLREAIFQGMRDSGRLAAAQIRGQNFHVDFIPYDQVHNTLHYISKDGPGNAQDPALRAADWGEPVVMRTQAGEVFNPDYDGGTDTADLGAAGVVQLPAL